MNQIISFLTSIFRKISSVFLSVFVALGLVAGNAVQSRDAITFKNPDAVKLSAVLISDTHIKNDGITGTQLQKAVEDINASEKPFDALVLSGDITDAGDKTSFGIAWSNLEKLKNIKILLTMGNHDSWSYDTAVKQIKTKATQYLDKTVDKPYYSYDLNGFTFIVLGSESANSDKAYISQQQLSFLDSELARATKDGKPAFVICHFPLKNTHGLPDIWRSGGDIGEQSDAIRNILTKYKNVFYINGHLHTGVSADSLVILNADKGVYSINLPAYGQPNAAGTFKITGLATYMEVYDKEVVFTLRNFQEGKAVGGFSRSITLK